MFFQNKLWYTKNCSGFLYFLIKRDGGTTRRGTFSLVKSDKSFDWKMKIKVDEIEEFFTNKLNIAPKLF